MVQNHDALGVHAVPLAKLNRDDIVAFRNPANPNQILTERIQQIDTPKGLITVKGDEANSSSQIDYSLLVGRVKYRMGYMGYTLDFLRSRYGLALCVYLPALLIVGQELKQLSATYKRETYRLVGSAHQV
jgi:hypothetical protein